MKKISNIEKRKRHYRNRVMEIIRQNEWVSRTDIKRLSRLSMTTTLETIEGMIDDGLLIESGTGVSTGGRKPTWLKINPLGGYFLGLEFTSEQVLYVIMDLCGTICFSGEKDIPIKHRTTDGVISIMVACISEMLEKVSSRSKVFGIGLGSPGDVDFEKGTVTGYRFIKDWEWATVPIRQVLSQHFNLPIYIENYVNAMTLAYKWLEYKGACDNLIFLIIREGLRMGCIVREQLLQGHNNNAGGINHIKVPTSNRMCFCGQKGCLMTEVTHGALLMKVKEGMMRGRFPAIIDMCKDREPVMQDIIKAVSLGDKDSANLVTEAAGYIGQFLSYVVPINNPRRIIIYTALSQCGPEFLQHVEDTVRNNCAIRQTKDLSFSYMQYGIHIGAIGAASIVMQMEVGVNPERLI